MRSLSGEESVTRRMPCTARVVAAGLGGGRAGRIEGIPEPAQVTLSGAVSGRYLVIEKQPGGELTLVPDTSISAIRQRQGTEPITLEEFEATFSGLPTDDEG